MTTQTPSGIHNPGNFCYIISAMQTLKTVQPLLKFFDKQEKTDAIFNDILAAANINTRVLKEEFLTKISRLADNYKLNPEILGHIIEKYGISELELNWHINKLIKEHTKLYLYIMVREFLRGLSTNDKTFTPNVLINVLATVFRDFGSEHLCNGGQNDVQEFLTVLLDYLSDSHSMPAQMNIPPAVLNLTEQELDSIPDLSKRIKCGLLRELNLRYSKEMTSLNSDMYFYNLNQIKCPGCNFSSLSYCPNNMLCVPVPDTNQSNGGRTLYDCLDNFFALDMLDGDYPCSKCGNKSEMGIQRYILTKPQILIICLKRFRFDSRSQRMGKNNTPVSYPEVLDIRKFNPIEEQAAENTQYRLIGIINHAGALNFGHYYSINKIGDKWWQHNDNVVTEYNMGAAGASNPHAYMLFYEKMVV